MTLPNKHTNILLWKLGILLFVFSLVFLSQTSPVNAQTNSFVKKSGTQLTLDGKPFRFTGVNAYQLGTLWGTNPGCGAQVDDLDGFFKSLRPNSVVRIWAFQGTIGTNVATKKTDFTPLDRVIEAAEKNNQKLIVAISGQSGTCDDGHWKDTAWYKGGFKQAFNDDRRGMAPLSFLEYTRQIVTRYKDSPAIAIWEPVSEPETTDCQPGYETDECYFHGICKDHTLGAQALRSFFDTVGSEIKRIDPNHLVGSGVIGTSQCGVNDKHYKYVHESPGIDVASYHDYENPAMPGDQWNGLATRLSQMREVNKPLIVGEVGVNARENSANCTTLPSRRDLMKNKMDTQFKAGISGFLLWSWHGHKSYDCNYDVTPGDPLMTLLQTYAIPAVVTPTPTLKPTATKTPSPIPTRKPSPTPTKKPTVTPTKVPSPAPAQYSPTNTKKLGGLDITGYCRNLNKPSASYKTSNWTCGGIAPNVNLSSVCIWQYKKTNAYARQDQIGNPYSWSCYAPIIKIGGMDIYQYCLQNKLPALKLTNNTWTCGSQSISMTNVCKWQYKNTTAYAQQSTAGNPYTWSCYK